MEFIIELLVEIVLEGTIAIGSEKKVPMPIRILCGIIEFILFFGFGGLLVYTGYDSLLENDTSGYFGLVIGIIIIIGGIFIVYKMFKKKRKHEEELW